MLKPHLQYLSYVLRHKWFVLKAGLTLRVPLWQLLAHDWSKFLPSEWLPYVRYFYDRPSEQDERVRELLPELCIRSRAQIDADFDVAWNLHQKRQPHHWQFWVLVMDTGEIKTLLMPERFAREMVADWIGAGLAQGKPDCLGWYRQRKDLKLHPATQQRVEELLIEAQQKGLIP